jgi:hypothetical protein
MRMQAVSDVIDLWPNPSEFASDVGATIGVVRVWKHRRSIPARYWSKIEIAAGTRGIEGATASDLARAAAGAQA